MGTSDGVIGDVIGQSLDYFSTINKEHRNENLPRKLRINPLFKTRRISK